MNLASFKGKKLLVLGGASVHCKLVAAAKSMGLYTIVADYLVDSPAKLIADEAWLIDIRAVEDIVKKCREEHVDGVIAGWLDPCQRPYAEICDKLNLPCYATAEQVYKMTDKHAFKKMCAENGVDVIPEYSYDDIQNNRIAYPVFVKPVDSRGSRGQSVCYNEDELKAAISFAKSESSNGDILIEKYMKDAHEFQVTYFFVDGNPFLIRTVDSYCGAEEAHLEKVVACAVSPSKYTQLYLEKAHKKVIQMFQNLGLKNGPVFMQGFEDHGTFRFFDPGLRFPGVDYEKIYKKVFGIDIMKAMIHIALEGNCGQLKLPEDGVWIQQKRAAVLFPTISAGTIQKLEGFETVRMKPSVVSLLPRYEVGDTIQWVFNVGQRLAEVDIIGETTAELKKEIDIVQGMLKAYNETGTDMTYCLFDTARIE